MVSEGLKIFNKYHCAYLILKQLGGSFIYVYTVLPVDKSGMSTTASVRKIVIFDLDTILFFNTAVCRTRRDEVMYLFVSVRWRWSKLNLLIKHQGFMWSYTCLQVQLLDNSRYICWATSKVMLCLHDKKLTARYSSVAGPTYSVCYKTVFLLSLLYHQTAEQLLSSGWKTPQFIRSTMT